MDDPIIEQAAAAAATPANDPPAPVATTPASDAAEMHAIATAQWHLAEQTNGTYTPTLAKPSDFTSRTQKAPVPSSISHLPPDQQAEYIARAQARTQAQMEAKKAADAAAKTRLAALPETERRRQLLSNPDNPDGIWSADPTKKATAMSEIRSIMAKSEGTATSTTADDLSDEEAIRWAGDVREQLGVVHPDWQGDVGVAADHEGNVLAYLAREGFDHRTIQSMATDFYAEIQRAGGLPASSALDMIKQRYGKVLGPTRIALLTRWWNEEVVGGDE